MEKILENLTTGFGISDVLDILIVAFIVYKLIGFIEESRAGQLVKGILILVVMFFLSDLLNLYTLHWLLKSTFAIGVIALVVVFQPELRRALENIGRSNFVNAQFRKMDEGKIIKIASEVSKAAGELSETRTGALLVFERETPLNDIIETGTVIDSEISTQIIGNIFYEGAPLHDGAVIVRGGKLYAAGCVLPLTQDKKLNKSLGTRHRAGIGVTESSDALTVIVSEETGIISIAENGNLKRRITPSALEKILLGFYCSKVEAYKAKWPILDKLAKRKEEKENVEK